MRRLSIAGRLALLCATAMAASPLIAASVQTRPDFRGVWFNEQTTSTLTPLDGNPPPLTPAGEKARAENLAKLQEMASKPKQRDDMRPCLPLGPTRILLAPYPLQIVQRNDLVIFLFEHNHVFETIYFKEDADPDPDSDPTYQGYAIARWEGKDMVVHNDKFNDQTVLDGTGLPHSEQLKVTRRLVRSNDGKQLQITSTIEDPEMYSRSWEVRQTFTLRPDLRIEEFVCGQGTWETRYTRRGQPEPQ